MVAVERGTAPVVRRMETHAAVPLVVEEIDDEPGGVTRHRLVGVAAGGTACGRIGWNVVTGASQDTIAQLFGHTAMVAHDTEVEVHTIEAGVVRVAGGLDMKKGRARIGFESGKKDIHSISAMAIEDVRTHVKNLQPHIIVSC